MISICIPLFNFDSRKLICDLSEQAEKLSVPYEILAVDDASEESFRILHRELSLPCFRYVELEKNVGRSKIRNLLIRESRYPYLVFMDCDMQVLSNDYLANYLSVCRPDIVCCGGHIYEKNPPGQKYLLHWKYGTVRESLSAKDRRNKSPHVFYTSNFLVDKSLLEKIWFDEQLDGYGYEDTLIGIKFADENIPILQIDNPLVHLGLENSTLYLSKVKNALKNLNRIERSIRDEKKVSGDFSGIINVKARLQSLGLKRLFVFFYLLFDRFMESNLKGKRPGLFVFDLYRLGFYCSL